MAIAAIKNASMLAAGVDFSAYSNMLQLEAMVEPKDSTTFSTSGWKTFLGVLKEASWNFSGFRSNTAEPDSIFYNPSTADPGVVLGATTQVSFPATATITNPLVEGDIAFNMRAIRNQIVSTGQVGELAGFNLALKGDQPMVRGRILATVAAASATASTTGFEVGATSATQKLYASLHVTSISTVGDTLDVIVESDDNSGFTSPTTRVTFTQVVSADGTHTAQWATPISGAITDTYYRITATIAGSSPSFSYVVFVGIQ